MKRRLVNFKLNTCCRVAPVRFGLLVTGYLNTALALISLVGLSDDSFITILMLVQQAIMEDNAKKPIPIIAYAVELSFSVILLCALYRRDVTLLRVYQRYCIVAIISSIMVYSIVVAAIGIIVSLALVISILFQVYVLLLVRSMIVEMKLETRNLELPTMVMKSNNGEKEVSIIHPVEEVKIDNSDSEDSDDAAEGSDKKNKLETVEEHSKEEAISEEEKEKK